METCLENGIDDNQVTLKESDEARLSLITEPADSEDQANDEEINSFPETYEETSYHELRCISNDINDSMAHFLPVDCKFYRTVYENGISDSAENTDDQLFIEIVKEDSSSKLDQDEETSIFDSITFNIEDHEDSMTQIKIINTENNLSVNDPSRYVFFKAPEENIPKITQVVRLKERRHRKPLGLANYCSLITQAINSSPEKRMILTDIYKWIMENEPFFREKEHRGKDGWKNCVRHTLSVNERFFRVRNRTNGRSSYWTVCEEGEFDTKFAEFPWASEIFKPEERKRVPKIKQKRDQNTLIVNSTNQSKYVSANPIKHAANTRIDAKSIKQRKVQVDKIKSSKPRVKLVDKKKKKTHAKNSESENCQGNSSEVRRSSRMLRNKQSTCLPAKTVNIKKHQTKNNLVKKVMAKKLKRVKTKKETKKYNVNNRGRSKPVMKNQVETVRRSSRRKTTHKTCKF